MNKYFKETITVLLLIVLYATNPAKPIHIAAVYEKLDFLKAFTFCSDLEKTFIDCLFKPDYAGGIVEVAKAIYASKEKINFETLLNYAKKFDSQAVIKRLGFLLELLEINSGIIDDLQKLKTASYVVLDTELPKTGRRICRWSIQQNLETETIKTALFT